MKVLVVLALALLAGCDASNFMRYDQRQVDLVKDAFWDSVSKATMMAEDSLKQVRRSELGKEVNYMISQSSEAVEKIATVLRTQVAPVTQDLLFKFSEQAEKLRGRLEKDLSNVGTNMQPYAEEAMVHFQSQVEQLKKQVAPYAESMDAETLKAVVMEKSLEMKSQLEQNMGLLQEQMGPFTEEMKQRMAAHLTEFQRSMVPLTESFQVELSKRAQELQQNLAPYAEELRVKLHSDTKSLRKQLMSLWKSFSKMAQ
ncbi:apolipoprotein A-IV-like [Synchiropus picturatus]